MSQYIMDINHNTINLLETWRVSNRFIDYVVDSLPKGRESTIYYGHNCIVIIIINMGIVYTLCILIIINMDDIHNGYSLHIMYFNYNKYGWYS